MSRLLLLLLLTMNSQVSIAYNDLYVVPFPSIIDQNGDGSRINPYSSL